MTEQDVVEAAEVGELMDSLLADVAATAGLQMTQIGIRTGLWKALAGAGPLTSVEVSARSGVAATYAREWLKHQVASGYVRYDPATEKFELPAAAAVVLGDDVQAGMVDGFASMLTAMTRDQALVEEAFRSGQGVGWHQRSAEHWHGMDLVTRTEVVPALVEQWIPALDGVADRLRAGAVVADIGCGYGAAVVALAQAYPGSRFTGYDYHDASVVRARKAAAAAGVSDRVTFEVADATTFPGAGYDLVTFIDTLHDLGDPLGALRQARAALRDDGTVLLGEFAAADRLEDNIGPLGRLLYASSALVCTPNAVAHGATDPLGTAAGVTRLADLATTAGFGKVRQVPVEAPLNLVLELRR